MGEASTGDGIADAMNRIKVHTHRDTEMPFNRKRGIVLQKGACETYTAASDAPWPRECVAMIGLILLGVFP